MDKKVLNTIRYYLEGISSLENMLFSLKNETKLYLLLYLTSYKPPAFAARNILAALDHNANVDREAVKNKDGSERYFSFAFFYTIPQNLRCIVLVCLYMYLFLFLHKLLLVILIILPQHIYINPIMIILSPTLSLKLAVICIADIYKIIIQCIGKEWHHPPTSTSFKKRKHTHTKQF